MVNPQGTSFIPQRPARGKTEARRVRKVYVLAYVAYITFFGSLLFAGAVFFFSFSLDVQIGVKEEALAAEQKQFNEGDIESVRDLDKRIKIAQERLNSHVSVLAIFEALERSTVESLQFIRFSYQRLNDQFPTVTFTGTSDRFNNVLFQREILSSNPILAGSSFAEIQLQSGVDENDPFKVEETVTFTLQKQIDTSLIGYTPRAREEDMVQEVQAEIEAPAGIQQEGSSASGIEEQTVSDDQIQ